MKTLITYTSLFTLASISLLQAADPPIYNQIIEESFRNATYDEVGKWVYDINGDRKLKDIPNYKWSPWRGWYISGYYNYVHEESSGVGLTASDAIGLDKEGEGYMRLMAAEATPTYYSFTADDFENYTEWDRLDDQWNLNQAAYIQYNDALRSKGLTVYAEFEFKIYFNKYNAGNGFYKEETASNGLLFYLYDADSNFAIGDRRSSMGYASLFDDGSGTKTYNGISGPYSWGYTNDGTGYQDEQDGMQAAYIGLGFDISGAFAHTMCKTGGLSSLTENTVALRGDTASEYEYIMSTADGDVPELDYDFYVIDPQDSEADIVRPTGYYNFRKCVLVIDSNNQLTVFMKARTDGLKPIFTTDLSKYDRPDNIGFGFTAGTGNSTGTIEIRDFLATAFTALRWDNDSGDSLWDTAENWETDNLPKDLGLEDVIFEDSFVTTDQTVDLGGIQTVRTVSIDGDYSYTLENGTLDFSSDLTEGLALSAIGSGTHFINCDIVNTSLLSISNNGSNDLTFNGSILQNGPDVRFSGASDIVFNGLIKGDSGGGLIKDGTGGLWINGDEANTYSGNTRLSYGTTYLNKDPATEGKNKALGTGAVYVAQNATVQWERNNQINNNSDIILSGGTLNLNGHNEWSE